MKISVIGMGIAWAFLLFFIILIISVWCSITGFGIEFIKLFNSINPSPSVITYSYSLTRWSNFTNNIIPILINLFYSIVDGLIIGIILGSSYNFSINILTKKANNGNNERTE
ncbi:MAG TPA: hypothetical protein PKW55_01700 [Spirochaetota bacterium]|jgi:hypothetical protein|nr:hypothetical protein [Spirochaetota bacterium]HOM38991.1 hypothetical protein [Spirochaetota bacterium]HPQ48350.1 hypothetical protein [Spirochaetota bacterium]